MAQPNPNRYIRGEGKRKYLKKNAHLRGGPSARRWGNEPKVHYRRGDYEGDVVSLCGRSLYGTPTVDPVDCKFCLKLQGLA